MNSKISILAGVAAMAMAACSGSTTSAVNGTDTNVDGVDTKSSLPDKLSIYYGTTAPTAFDVPTQYQWAIGALLSNGQNFCTGTLIDYDVVLSAAHCAIDDYGNTMSTSGISFGIGTNMKNPTKKIAVKKIINNTAYTGQSAEHDVALFILKSKAQFSGGPNISPIPLNKASLTGLGLKGKIVQNVGYGSTENNDYNTKRFWTTEEVKSVNSYEFQVDGKGKSSVCFGDSGGPSLYVVDNQIRIMGTVSWGGQSCVDVDHYASVADNISWINEQLKAIGHDELQEYLIPQTSEDDAAATDVDSTDATDVADSDTEVITEADNCGDVTFTGKCDGNTAVWCDGQVYERDCSQFGQVCDYVADVNGYYCRDTDDTAASDTGCGDIDYLGTCDGDVAKWCDNGEIKQRDCTLFNQTCAYIDSQWGHYCK